MNKQKFIHKWLESEQIDESTTLFYHGVIDLLSEIYDTDIAAAPDMADRIRELEAQNAAMLTELIDFCRGNCDTCELQECTDTCGLIGAKNIIETIEGRPIEEVLA